VNWLTNYVRPKIRALVGRERPEVPENLWHQCPACERMIFHRDLEANQRVCPHCAHHMRVDPEYRFKALFDEGSWQRIELPKVPADPLKFRDQKRYSDRLKEAQARTKAQDALEAAHGTIDGLPAVIAVMNFDFMAGTMGTALGEGFIAAARLAVLQEAAFIVVTASGGARMQEGPLSLMQMARTTIAVEEVKEAGLPYIVILTDPTTGGVTASFAMLGDIHLAEPGAVIGFAGARVIEQTIREKLPEGFQRAEYLLEHGMIDQVVHRFQLRATLARLLDLLLRRDRADQATVAGPQEEETPAETEAAGVPAVVEPVEAQVEEVRQ
jgi:acetyl-CoA carboxylase carboxyl transferase subunit beta